MSDFKCYNCDGTLVESYSGKYFTYFTCSQCKKYFCLAHDRCDTWSWLNRSKSGNPQFWVDCSKVMHEKNPIKVKVVFT